MRTNTVSRNIKMMACLLTAGLIAAFSVAPAQAGTVFSSNERSVSVGYDLDGVGVQVAYSKEYTSYDTSRHRNTGHYYGKDKHYKHGKPGHFQKGHQYGKHGKPGWQGHPGQHAGKHGNGHQFGKDKHGKPQWHGQNKHGNGPGFDKGKGDRHGDKHAKGGFGGGHDRGGRQQARR